MEHEDEGEVPVGVYPVDRSIGVSVPEVIQRIYDEAWRVRHASPNSFAVQIRKALEAICEHKSIGLFNPRSSLDRQLKELV
jgi:hypothetical protein